MIMRKLFICSLFLFLATGCHETSEPERNPFESGIKVVKKATEELKSAKDDNEIAAIMQNLVVGMDSIDKSDEWRDYMLLYKNNDTAALKKFEPAKKELDSVMAEFNLALSKACAQMK